MLNLENGYAELMEHRSHHVEIVTYGDGEGVALECTTCGCVLLDFDRGEETGAEPPEKEAAITFTMNLLENSGDVVNASIGSIGFK